MINRKLKEGEWELLEHIETRSEPRNELNREDGAWGDILGEASWPQRALLLLDAWIILKYALFFWLDCEVALAPIG